MVVVITKLRGYVRCTQVLATEGTSDSYAWYVLCYEEA